MHCSLGTIPRICSRGLRDGEVGQISKDHEYIVGKVMGRFFDQH